MGFASEYLETRLLFEPFICSKASINTGIIVCIPAFDEPEILCTLDSLASCTTPECNIEVLIHLNASGKASIDQVERNKETLRNIESWNSRVKPDFRLFAFNSGINSSRDWGAGMARKVVMDEALSRFNSIDKPDGVIVSLDADCRVSKNYFVEIHRELKVNTQRSACSIYFEHPLEGEGFTQEVYSAISSYELYLRYYYQALRFSDFPAVFHTVGSAFAVKADTYLKSGGMGKHQAGEDFYFIQKTIPMGGYFYLTSACVYPSPRASDRVPFGTGPTISELLNNPDVDYLTYNPDAFLSLKVLFSNVPKLVSSKLSDIEYVESLLSRNILNFLTKEDWRSRISEINKNTATEESFVKRFFQWFNMFKVVKYLNWSNNEGSYLKVPVSDAGKTLLGLLGEELRDGELMDLLLIYRKLEK